MIKRIPVFVVNLERSADRRLRMKGILDRMSIHHEFVAAFDGSKADESFMQSTIHGSDFMKRLRGKDLTRGEVGCSLSHLTLYKRIVDENIPVACIIEDDIDITDSGAFDCFTDSRYCSSQKEWDLLLLGHIQEVENPDKAYISLKKYSCGKGARFGVPVQFCYSTTGYVITQKAAQILLEKGYPVRVPADFLTGDSAKYGIRLMAAYPKVIIPNREYFENEKSLVSDGHIRTKKIKAPVNLKSLVRHLLYRCLIAARAVGVLRKKKYYDF